MVSLLTLFAACGFAPLDPSDCAYFTDCTRWRPQGLALGLAHQAETAEGQTGSSTRASDGTIYDPARTALASGVVSNRSAPSPCPPDDDQALLYDHEASMAYIAECLASGNDDTVPMHPDDLPEGAVCGLSNGNGADQSCGSEASPGRTLTCPEHWTLHWIPDYYVDRVDSACTSTGDNTGELRWEFDFDFYCSFDEGCDECDDDVRDAGILCGMHEMESAESFLGGTSESVDLVELLDRLFTDCPDHPDAANRDVLEVAAAAPITCLGETVTDGACPQGLVSTCTWDQVAVSTIDWAPGNIAPTAWCWCVAPDLVQGMAAPVSR